MNIIPSSYLKGVHALLDPVGELLLPDQLQEGRVTREVAHHRARGADLRLGIDGVLRQHHALHLVALHDELVHRAAGEEPPAVGGEAGAEGVGDGVAAAAAGPGGAVDHLDDRKEDGHDRVLAPVPGQRPHHDAVGEQRRADLLVLVDRLDQLDAGELVGVLGHVGQHVPKHRHRSLRSDSASSGPFVAWL